MRTSLPTVEFSSSFAIDVRIVGIGIIVVSEETVRL
jgi:hypothetical protein